MKLAICVPIHMSAQIHVSFFINFINRLGDLDPKKYNPIILFSTKIPIDKARNHLVKTALEKGATHIWFIDVDQVIPRGTLEELLNMDVDIASGLYFEKGIPYWPCLRKWDPKKKITWWRFDDIKWGSSMQVDGCGMGCILIKAKVFKKIKPPWFLFKWHDDELLMGEDLYFSMKAREAGFKIFVNTKFVVGHIGGLVTEKEFEAYQNLRNEIKRKDKEKYDM